MKDFRSLEQKIRQVWIDEAEARNTTLRKKVENVGRPQDDNKDPETSKLAKQGEIKTKIIDEEKHRVAVTVSEPDHPMVTKRKEHKQKFVKVSGDKDSAIEKAKEYYKKAGYKVHGAEYHSLVNEVTLDIGPNTGPNEEAEDNQKEKDPKKLTGGKTEVILDPKTDDRPEEQTMEDEKHKKTVKQENKKIGTKSGVKEETMTKLTFGLPESLIDSVRQVVEAKKTDIVCEKCGKSPCKCKPPMKEEVEQIDEVSSKKLDSYREKAFDASKKAMHTGDKKTEKKRDLGRHLAFDKLTGRAKVTAKEEVSFSDAELAHIESIMGEAKEYNTPVDKDMGPLNVAAQIRKGKDVGGHVEVTHPHTGKTHKIPVKVANKFNADYASAEKPAHKEKIEQDFVKQHMS